jgi:hypothetical protein
MRRLTDARCAFVSTKAQRAPDDKNRLLKTNFPFPLAIADCISRALRFSSRQKRSATEEIEAAPSALEASPGGSR